MTLEELEILFDGCKNGNRLSQKRLYQQFYAFGMSISVRYAQNHEEAEEICHDGFVKVFSKIDDCASIGAFKGWMRQVFIHCAIDYLRKYRLTKLHVEEIEVAMNVPLENTAIEKISADEKLSLVQALPASYRVAFNLYVIEGFSTAEIAELLKIAEGTVRANLAKARLRLQSMIEESNKLNIPL